MHHKPDHWVILNFYNESGTLASSKVLAGWRGGFTQSNHYQLNSGNVSCVEYDDYYEFTSQSGSLYICYKYAYGLSNIMQAKLDEWYDMVGKDRVKIDERYSCKK